jgi:hypothetical protein
MTIANVSTVKENQLFFKTWAALKNDAEMRAQEFIIATGLKYTVHWDFLGYKIIRDKDKHVVCFLKIFYR